MTLINSMIGSYEFGKSLVEVLILDLISKYHRQLLDPVLVEHA